ncbi:MAG: LysM peptidoglycan-binding domain-containing protein [Lachnospiraceae bacterium]|nr:LysM peptidoglycan-binding domain-containing protein [Lachnospiraceae bacterium]
MRNHKSLYSRISKRKSNYNQKLARIIVILSVVLCFTFSIVIFATPAKGNEKPRYKYFKSIEIEAGDTLWSIAEEYMTKEYKCTMDYVKELKSMNGLTSDTIHEGNSLVIAYYSDELK